MLSYLIILLSKIGFMFGLSYDSWSRLDFDVSPSPPSFRQHPDSNLEEDVENREAADVMKWNQPNSIVDYTRVSEAHSNSSCVLQGMMK
jgi:hypothetical protein